MWLFPVVDAIVNVRAHHTHRMELRDAQRKAVAAGYKRSRLAGYLYIAAAF